MWSRVAARASRRRRGDRLVDTHVLVAREIERPAIGDTVPQARAHGARREAPEQCAQHAVARRPRDHVVKRGVGLDELVGAVAGGDHAVELAAEGADHSESACSAAIAAASGSSIRRTSKSSRTVRPRSR